MTLHKDLLIPIIYHTNTLSYIYSSCVNKNNKIITVHTFILGDFNSELLLVAFVVCSRIHKFAIQIRSAVILGKMSK